MNHVANTLPCKEVCFARSKYNMCTALRDYCVDKDGVCKFKKSPRVETKKYESYQLPNGLYSFKKKEEHKISDTEVKALLQETFS